MKDQLETLLITAVLLAAFVTVLLDVFKWRP